MTALFLTCALIGLVPYTIASWAVADGLPLFRDWHYWAGIPVVVSLGLAVGWLLGNLHG